MRKKLALLVSTIAVIMLTIGTAWPGVSHAFTSNDLMDDSVFDNTASMSASQSYPGSNIDAWINNNFPSSCISTNHGFQAQDPTGYSPSGGFTYGGNVSAGHVIYDAALTYGLNPQVLLATLQKEQSLVSGGGGCGTLAYAAATGYGCPDSGTTYSYNGVNLYSINGIVQSAVGGTCVNSVGKVGFSEQIIHAAWLLKFGEQRSEGKTGFNVQLTNSPEPGDHWDNSDDPQTCYEGPMTQGSYERCSTDAGPVSYDGYDTIDGVSTHMDTGPTAALYWYTPHFNGNQNFDNIFNAWFGSVYGNSIGSTVYRLYNPQYNDHYYTAIQNVRQGAKVYQGYRDDGIAFNAGTAPAAGMVPIYALYNGRLHDHWLVPDGIARYWGDNFGGYADSGVAFYAYPTVPGATGMATVCPSGSVPVYSLWSLRYGDHFYSTSGGDRYWMFIFAGYRDDSSSTYVDSNGNGSVAFCAPS